MLTTEPRSAVAGGGAPPRVADASPLPYYSHADPPCRCAGCDSRQGRAWACEGCELAPAAFFCRADAASLCASCDAEVHAANPLAGRHQRVPISDCLRAAVPGGAAEGGDEDEAASWLSLDALNGKMNDGSVVCGGGEVDEYFDLVDYSQFESEDFNQKQKNYAMDVGGDGERRHRGDGVVPVDLKQGRDYLEQMQQQGSFQMEMECEYSEAGHDCSASISHSASGSSEGAGVVPESTAAVSQSRSAKGAVDLLSGPSPAVPEPAVRLSAAERMERVVRYREKKKARRFEKTIRYASRKAYAERRPRVKGRFARRDDADGHRPLSSSPTAAVALTAESTACGGVRAWVGVGL